ncbi:hypothetical protein WA026_022093 [Henosepilachna vigintioctopunctata]|uniref:Uncharacterized protein n=1 Tax=Henosepilachna vigintioctopunctata TaxID=420089 RepID=A0AAW1U793_9CUCU
MENPFGRKDTYNHLTKNNAIDFGATLTIIVEEIKKLSLKVDLLLDDNSNLKNEIANLKKVNDKSVLPKVNVLTSYADAIGKSKKVLIVNQKCPEKDVKRVKIDLKTNVDPIDIGAGISMGKAIKNEGVIVECGSGKDLISIQTKIQNKMGTNYSVDIPKGSKHRLKVVGISESEHILTDSGIVSKIEEQHELKKCLNRKI